MDAGATWHLGDDLGDDLGEFLGDDLGEFLGDDLGDLAPTPAAVTSPAVGVSAEYSAEFAERSADAEVGVGGSRTGI